MPIELKGQKFYTTNEVLEMIKASKQSFFRWLKEGRISDPKRKDRRGWRLWTEDEAKAIQEFDESITTE